MYISFVDTISIYLSIYLSQFLHIYHWLKCTDRNIMRIKNQQFFHIWLSSYRSFFLSCWLSFSVCIYLSIKAVSNLSQSVPTYPCILIDWVVFWVLWHINLCRLFKVKSIFMKIVLFQKIQFSISTKFKCKYSLIVKNDSVSSYSV